MGRTGPPVAISALVLMLTACTGSATRAPSALDDPTSALFPPPLIEPAALTDGGPPPDGIPAIDAPNFVSVTEAGEWMATNEPVMFVEVEGDVHAYPVQVMILHEIVNDTVGGVPVVVTYCPLCNSAISFIREVDGQETTFGTSGKLYGSALVMYDRLTETLWTHYNGEAVVGMLAGTRLEEVPSPLVTWSELSSAFPEALVLDRETTGWDFPYGENPYDGYENAASTPFLFQGEPDGRALPKQRVVGVDLDGVAAAWTLGAVSGDGVRATHGRVGETAVVVFWREGQTSALDTRRIVSGRSVGTIGVFVPVVDGQPTRFEARDGAFVDEATGTSWDVTGNAVQGPLEGSRLDRVPHLDTFWFAWETYHPDTRLFDTG